MLSIYFQRVFFSTGFLRSGLLPECHSLIWHLRHTHVLLVEGFLSTSQCYPFKTILILFWHIISNTQSIRIIIIEYILLSLYSSIQNYLHYLILYFYWIEHSIWFDCIVTSPGTVSNWLGVIEFTMAFPKNYSTSYKIIINRGL